MARYRILYLQDSQVEKFRDRAPKKPPFYLKEHHYDEGPEVEADTPYVLWQQLQEQPESDESPRPIRVGDVLLTSDGELLVCNFWGFDQAEWLRAEHSGQESAAPAGDGLEDSGALAVAAMSA